MPVAYLTGLSSESNDLQDRMAAGSGGLDATHRPKARLGESLWQYLLPVLSHFAKLTQDDSSFGRQLGSAFLPAHIHACYRSRSGRLIERC